MLKTILTTSHYHCAMSPPAQGVPGDGPVAENPGIRRLSGDDVRRIAALARLELSDAQVAQYQLQLSAVLGYMEQLRAIDTAGVEPMTHPGARTNALDDDAARTPDDTLATRALLDMAPQTLDQFVRVPKVLGEGGGA